MSNNINLSTYEKIAKTKNICISDFNDLKKTFPDNYQDKDFLEYIAIELLISNKEAAAKVCLVAIGDDIKPNYSYVLAGIYYNADNFKEALPCYQKALTGGEVRSYYWMGRMFEEGQDNVPINLDIAFECYQLGAEYGYVLPTRAYFKMDIKKSSFIKKIFIKLKLLIYGIKVMFIAFNNVDDERLSEFMPRK